jgi:hypothetical protein
MNCKPVPKAEPPPQHQPAGTDMFRSAGTDGYETRDDAAADDIQSTAGRHDIRRAARYARRDGARRGAGNHNSRHATASFAVGSAGVAWVDPWELEQAASRFAAVRLDARQRGGPPPRTVTLMTSPYRRSTPSLFARRPARFCKAEWRDAEDGGAQPVPNFGRLVALRRRHFRR